MIINPKIKDTVKEISKESIKHYNTANPNRKYHKRLLKLFKENLTEEEQIYLINVVFESMHYKHIVTDPDNVLTLHTIKLRNITYTFLLIFLTLFIAAALFKTNETLNGILEILTNGLKLLSI